MSWAKNNESLRTVLYSGLVLSLAAFGLWFGASANNTSANTTAASPSTIFPGTGVGSIPDSTSGTCGTNGAPLNVSFAATGISSAPSNVSVDFTAGVGHTWVGDITATLIAPNGTSHTVFGFTGATTANAAGSSNNLVAGTTYTFNDAAATNWWTHALGNVNIPTGTFRTSNSGGAGATNPMPATNMNAAFSAIPTSNGTWTLRFTDGCNGDTGSISAANLDLTGASVPVNAPHDVTGDGRSDFMVVRADGAPLGEFMGANDIAGKDKVGNMQRRTESLIPQVGIGWWVANGATSSIIGRFDHGQDTDFFLNGDFDNDGRDDLTVWSPGAATVAAFRILQSSTSTVLTIPYGQNGDDPTVSGDWNGDGRDDIAVYRDGTAGSPQSTFFWTSVTTPATVNFVPWGTDGDVAFAMDFDGDGRNDPGIQRNGGGGAGHIWIRQSSDGATVFRNFGLSSDFVVPGDYDGDGRDDICVSRNANFGAGTFKYFWILESDGGGTPSSPFQWGIPGDFITQGDYDGDGRTDLGVWRSNVDPTLNFFFVRRSSDGGLTQFEWGASGDYPVNNWNVH